MIFDIRISFIVGLFIIICIALMIFNFIITHHSRGQSTPSADTVKKWISILNKQVTTTPDNTSGTLKHEQFLLKRLSNIEELIAYFHALQHRKSESLEAYNNYAHKQHEAFQKLADRYKKKSSTERACYANFICDFPDLAGNPYGHMVDILISYIDNSTVHCRMSVLRVLCSIGSTHGIVNALQVINDKHLFVHKQLLTDELLNFKGDKEILGAYLWSGALHWNDNIADSVVQFITRFSDSYNEVFLPVLQNSSIGAEVRIAIIRYYGKYVCEAAQPTLIGFITEPTNINLACEAAFALALYPTYDTITALKSALYRPEWNLRYSASLALIKMKNTIDLLSALENESNYATELVTYMLELEYMLSEKEMDGEIVIA